MTKIASLRPYRSLSVPLGDRSYDIRIGPGLLTGIAEHVQDLLDRPFLPVVTDEHVADYWLDPVIAGLEAGGIDVLPIILPAGETTKSFAQLEALLDRLLDARVERRDKVLALGGGVIGDLTGFACAVLRRGVDFIQAPTSLLAQVDSSVGGKTGINTGHGKNLVGAFHQPVRVLADVDSLSTLPDREIRAGFAEVIKYGLIDQPDFFEWLEEEGAEAVLAGDDRARTRAILTSCQAKADVVAADEREGGKRALLNLGHTFGHGLEALLGYDGRLLHGEAVATGMVMAMDFSAQQGLCSGEDAARARAVIEAAGLPVDVDPTIVPEALMDAMMQDKKVESGKLTLILSRGIGKAFIARDTDRQAVRSFLEEWLPQAQQRT